MDILNWEVVKQQYRNGTMVPSIIGTRKLHERCRPIQLEWAPKVLYPATIWRERFNSSMKLAIHNARTALGAFSLALTVNAIAADLEQGIKGNVVTEKGACQKFCV